NAAGAAPPLSVFSFHHCAPQNVTAVPFVAFPSPMTNVPPAGVAKMSTSQLVDVVLPPTSAMVTVIVNVAVVAYVWVPLTSNGPPTGPLTVPDEVVRSPHEIVAV